MAATGFEPAVFGLYLLVAMPLLTHSAPVTASSLLTLFVFVIPGIGLYAIGQYLRVTK